MIRRLAWELLRSGSTTPTREVARVAEEEDLDARDRGLLQRIVTTEVRRRGTLHELVRHFARGRPNRDLATHLRLGLAQLFFMDRVPPHAVVSETVRATADTLGLSKGRYVNAVLRTTLREHRKEPSGDPRRDLVGRQVSFSKAVFVDPEEHPFLWAEGALSMPAALVKRWSKRYGREAAFALARDCLDDPRLSLRVVRGTREEIAGELGRDGIATEPGRHPAILTAGSDALADILGHPGLREGRVTVQGEAALRAAESARASSGERWLDLCASPGGKTAVLAACGARVVACDVSEAKTDRLRETLERLGLAERVEVLRLEGDEGPEESGFDGVLLDVPCTNTAVLARRPEARWRWGPKTRASLAELQEKLLETGAERARAGGVLLYSTCSLEPDENVARLRAFLDRHRDWSLEEEEAIFPNPQGLSGPVDGGYFARLRRQG